MVPIKIRKHDNCQKSLLQTIETDILQQEKAIVSFEPGSGFMLPEREVPASMESAGGILMAKVKLISDLMKLTRIPIIIYHSDKSPKPVQ